MNEHFDRFDPGQLARSIDISCVRAFHTREEIDAMIRAAKKYRFISVFTLPAFSEYTAEKLKHEPDIHTGGVVGFPSGGDTIAQKSRQAAELREMGCGELDMVMNITSLKSREDEYVLEEICSVKESAGALPLKVIVEAPSLTEEEIRRAVELCIRGGADYVKTSTGWHASPSELKHIQIMASQAGGRIALKAAGGIRTLETIRSMRAAGCSRFGLGLPSALRLMSEMEEMYRKDY